MNSSGGIVWACSVRAGGIGRHRDRQPHPRDSQPRHLPKIRGESGGNTKVEPGSGRILFRPGTAPRAASGLVMLALLLGTLGSGCTLLPRAVNRGFHRLESLFSAGGPKTTIDPVKLQEDLLRYADDLTSIVMRAATELESDGAPIPRKDVLTIWISVDSAVVKTATGSNSLANLVNMIVLTTAMRMRVEEYWLPNVYGESARSLLEGLSSCEREIWQLGETVITPSERQQLLDTIDDGSRKRSDRPVPRPSPASPTPPWCQR